VIDMARWLATLERGRWPHVVAVITTGVLAAMSPLRFIILVGRMTPDAYGYLSVFNTLTSLLPYALALGLPLQFQLLTGRFGVSALGVLRPMGIRVVLLTSIPAVGACYLFARPFAEASSVVPLAAMSVITSACVAWTILLSQTLLGLRARAASVLAMFGYNSLLTGIVLPFVLWQPGAVSVSAVMLAWTIASIVGLIVAIALLGLTLGRRGPADAHGPVPTLGVFKGLPILPTLAGPWLLLMLVRYILGVTSGGQALATFALSWTLVDLAFLMAATLPTLASTDVMLGRRSAWPVFATTTVFLVLLLVVGIVVLQLVVASVAPSYGFSMATTLLVAIGAIGKVAVITWLPRSVGRGREGRVSLVYLVALAGLALGLLIIRPTSPEAYALALSASFTFVALFQILLTGRKQPTGAAATVAAQ